LDPFENPVHIPENPLLHVNEHGNFLKLKFDRIGSAGVSQCDCLHLTLEAIPLPSQA
jgi:hypothetical protein